MFEGLAKDSIDKKAAERSALRCWATLISIKNYDDVFFSFFSLDTNLVEELKTNLKTTALRIADTAPF